MWFVDSDDCILTDSLKHLLRIITETQPDFIRLEKKIVPENCVSVHSDIKEITTTDKWLGPATACNFIVKKDYLEKNNIHFDPEISYGEDTMWVFRLGYYPNKHIFIQNAIYLYRQRHTSAMGCVNKIKHLGSMLRMTEIYHDAYIRQEDGSKRIQLLQRTSESAQNALFDALRISYLKSKETLSVLTESGVYPYPQLWQRITLKHGINNFIINLLSVFFPKRNYYLAVSWFFNLIKRTK